MRELPRLRVAGADLVGGQIGFFIDSMQHGAADFEALGCSVEEATPDLSGADEIFVTLRALSYEFGLGPLLASAPARAAFDLEREPAALRNWPLPRDQKAGNSSQR